MLNKIVADKRSQVAVLKEKYPINNLINNIQPGRFALSAALRQTDWSLIAECKLASPLKGRLCSRFSVPQLAEIYARNGAAAISVLTDSHFHGSIEDLTDIRQITALPLLRKDFIIDPYQLFEARAAGADAVLLIARILSSGELREFLKIAQELGLDCLVEVHSKDELDAVLATEATIIGINNRDLKTFSTDINHTFALLSDIGHDKLVISESGITGHQDVLRLREAGVQGALVGEGLVTSADIAAKVRELALKQ